jgi:hypothetical protein
VPVGIPAFFIADQLSRGRSVEQIFSGNRGLIAENATARAHGQPGRFGLREGLP